MKKLFAILLLPALLVLGSCKPIDPVKVMNEYNNVVVYSHDLFNNTGVATDYASLTVKGDFSSGFYLLGLNDFKLAESLPVKSSTVNGLIQYLDEEKNSNDEIIGYNYAYFQTQGMASYTGDLQVMDLKFGWLSTVYWGSFVSDGAQYRVWFLPRNVQMYANRNSIVNVRGDSIPEKAIRPRFDMEFDVVSSTVTFSASAITLPVSASTGEKFEIRNMKWPALPVIYNEKGLTIATTSFKPITDGSTEQYQITDFSCNFETDFEGTRMVEYTLTKLDTGTSIRVNSYFDYFRQTN